MAVAATSPGHIERSPTTASTVGPTGKTSFPRAMGTIGALASSSGADACGAPGCTTKRATTRATQPAATHPRRRSRRACPPASCRPHRTGSTSAVSFAVSASAKKTRCATQRFSRKRTHDASAITASSVSLRPGIHATADARAGCTAKTSAPASARARPSPRRRSKASTRTLATA